MVFRAVRTHFHEIEKKCDISGSQLWVLSCINVAGSLRVTEIAEKLSIHQSTASNLIERMVKDGLVKKIKSSTDQRVTNIFLTEAGKAILHKAPGPAEGLLPATLKQLSTDELRQIQGALDMLLGKMDVDPAAKHTPLADL